MTDKLRFADSLTPAQRTIHDALCDSQWLTGLKAGWNAGRIQDPDKALEVYNRMVASRDGHLEGYREARAALATAPQPAPEPLGGCGLPCGFDCNGACFDPAPAPADERAAMIEVIETAVDDTALVDGEPWGADAVADALLAAGWTRGGAEAGMREARNEALREAAAAVSLNAWKHEGNDAYSQGLDRGSRDQNKRDYEAVLDLLNTPSASAAALASPSVPETLAAKDAPE